MRNPIRPTLQRAAVALAVSLLAACQASVAPTWSVPDGVRTTPVNGYPLATSDTGAGKTLVLLPGILCDYRCFPGQAALADSARVVAVSFRRTFPEPYDGSGAGYNLAQNASDVIALLQTLNPPVTLMGHSFGGAVAARVALQRPDLVARLVLAEAATGDMLPPGEAQARSAGMKQFADATEAILKSKGPTAAAEFAMDAVNGAGTWPRLPEPVRRVIADEAWTAVNYGRDPTPTANCEQLASLKMPVLLVTGQNTGPSFKRIVALQAQCMPAAKVVTIAGVGHSVQMNPPALNAALRAFMNTPAP